MFHKQKYNATYDYLRTVLTTESLKYTITEEPHNNNRVTRMRDILKQRGNPLGSVDRINRK